MEEFIELFHSKLYDREALLKWELPDMVKEQLGLDENEFFFLTSAKEESHKGHRHVHLSIFPTSYDMIKLLEIETSTISPKILQEILKTVIKHKFEVLTSTGTCKEKNKCFFGIFFTKPQDSSMDNLILELKKIKNVLAVKVYNYTCDGCCEE